MTFEPLLVVAAAGVVAGIVLSGLAIGRLVRLARQPELARAPVAARSAVTFTQPGRVELALEGPLFTTQFRGLGFELVDDTGLPIPLRRLWVRTSSGGFSRTRLSLYRADIPRPGTVALQVTGIDASADYGRCAILFVRPSGAGVALTVVSLLASVGLAAASLATAVVLLVRPVAEDVAGPTPAAPRTRTTVPDARGGRSFASDPGRIGTPLEVVWPVLRMHVRVPSDWLVRKLTTTELDLRHPRTPSTFLVGHVTPMPAGPTFDDYLAAHVAHAREQLAMRLIDGFATKPIGLVAGVLTLEQRGDGSARRITWTGFQPAAIGSLSITLLAGAAGEDFAREEALLGAIFDSISFE